jgi:hypothetical protein
LNRAELARHAVISVSIIADYEAGVNTPRPLTSTRSARR